MSRFSNLVPTWDTSCVGGPASLSQMDRLMLTEHLAHCDALRRPLLALWTGFTAIHRMLGERTLTGMLLIATLAAVVWLAL